MRDRLLDLFAGYNWVAIPAAMLTIIVHEISHGLVALALGDRTAKIQGRLSLNPLKHIDPIGLIVLIVFGVGWAKPVSVDMRYFKRPKFAMALTSIAGPVSNFVLAALSIIIMAVMAITDVSNGFFTAFFASLARISIGLGVFNLIPIPPLDGSKILFSLLPDRLYYLILRYERYGMLLIIILLNIDITATPVMMGMYYVTFYMVQFITGFFPEAGFVFLRVITWIYPFILNSFTPAAAALIFYRGLKKVKKHGYPYLSA